MAPAALLAPRSGMRVLDLCAAPGGKSTQLLSALAGRGLLVSNELHPGRAKILSQNLERVGAANALVLNEHPARLPPEGRAPGVERPVQHGQNAPRRVRIISSISVCSLRP